VPLLALPLMIGSEAMRPEQPPLLKFIQC
jgi:hypothetical protein